MDKLWTSYNVAWIELSKEEILTLLNYLQHGTSFGDEKKKDVLTKQFQTLLKTMSGHKPSIKIKKPQINLDILLEPEKPKVNTDILKPKKSPDISNVLEEGSDKEEEEENE